MLSGVLPNNLGLTSITSLWLNNNNFSGCIPNSYYNFCINEANVRLNNNPLLPFSGNYTMLCLDSLGADFDNDAYCGGSSDCNDTLNTVFPNAPEICDGFDNDCDTIIDENITPIANNWLAIDNDWHNPANWSTGKVPLTCHSVNILPSVVDSVIIFANKRAVAASVNIGLNGILHIQSFSSLTMPQKGGITNSGILSIYGNILIDQPLSPNIGLTNAGSIFIAPSGRFECKMYSSTGLVNNPFKTITNNGIMTFTKIVGSSTSSIINRGIINNFNIIQLK
jgi:hypothetical protein